MKKLLVVIVLATSGCATLGPSQCPSTVEVAVNVVVDALMFGALGAAGLSAIDQATCE